MVKVAYVRNLRNYRFGTKSLGDIVKIENEVKSKLPSIGYNLKFIKLKDLNEIDKGYFFEKRLIDKEDLQNENISMLLNDDESICVKLNGEEHIEIQVLNKDLDVESPFRLAKEIDEKFNNLFDIAKSKKYGFLTTSPLYVGTGLKVAAKIHLPGLAKTGNIRSISKIINDFGLSFEPVYVKGQEVLGDMYKIENKQTLGLSEDTIIKNFRAIVDKVIKQERIAKSILGKNELEFEDMVYRSFGILTNARKLGFSEALNLMSDVKMGVDMGVIKEFSDEDVNKIYSYINDCSLQKYFNKNFDEYDRKIKRAEMIKNILEKGSV